MATRRASRISTQKILADLRLAGRKGDRSALSIAVDGMRTLAHSPRYWEKYLALLRNPLARLVDLTLIKQGEKIAHQKGWKISRRGAAPPSEASPPARKRGQSPRSKRLPSARAEVPQQSLFD